MSWVPEVGNTDDTRNPLRSNPQWSKEMWESPLTSQRKNIIISVSWVLRGSTPTSMTHTYQGFDCVCFDSLVEKLLQFCSLHGFFRIREFQSCRRYQWRHTTDDISGTQTGTVRWRTTDWMKHCFLDVPVYLFFLVYHPSVLPASL